MDDATLHTKISALVDEEHTLRAKVADKRLSAQEEHERLRAIETELDRLWDLLRQRAAKREFGRDEDTAHERSAATVEGYRP